MAGAKRGNPNPARERKKATDASAVEFPKLIPVTIRTRKEPKFTGRGVQSEGIYDIVLHALEDRHHSQP